MPEMCLMQLLQVALDVADALRYLHHHSYPQILHRYRRLKCSILIDTEMAQHFPQRISLLTSTHF